MTVQFADGAREVVPDSAAIMRRLDTLMEMHGPPGSAPIVPTREVADEEAHIGLVVDGLVFYFNHFSDTGWARSICAKVHAALPPVIRELVPYVALIASVRAAIHGKIERC